jgi:hypothetical protein
MRYTVYVRNYQFNPPSQITESEYNYYKQLIKSDPKAKLNGDLKSPLKKGLKIAGKIAMAPLFMFAPYAIEGEVKSAINRARAKKEEDEFYEELKKFVTQSTSFQEFCSLVKNRFKYYR